MKSISIKQPYANWIINSEKIYEIRSWKTDYRGALIIASSQKPASHLKDVSKPPFGAIVGKVQLVDIKPFTKSMAKKAKCDYQPGLYAWVLEKPVKARKNIEIKGKLSLYELPDKIIKSAF